MKTRSFGKDSDSRERERERERERGREREHEERRKVYIEEFHSFSVAFT